MLMLVYGLVVVAFLYGYGSRHFGIFPAPVIWEATHVVKLAWRDLRDGHTWHYSDTDETRTVIRRRPAEMAPGMTLVGLMGPKGEGAAKLVDDHGRVLHSWDTDWFRLWPHATHVPKADLPVDRPGSETHGMVLSRDGDLTFNFERLGMVQLDVCGRVKWRLPRPTHHSLQPDETGNMWALELIRHTTPVARLPNFKPPFEEDFVVQISPDGRVLQSFAVADLLAANGLQGLLYLSSKEAPPSVSNSFLHSNDVEVFPSTLREGVFKAGDMMVSIRDMNAIIVFDPATRKIRHVFMGPFVRQHDPDFVDGDTISIFDNNPVGESTDKMNSRILQLSARTGEQTVMFEGTADHPFFSGIMGKHQLLPNRGMLIAETIPGRVLEINSKGEVVWEYFNIVRPGRTGQVSDAERIAPEKLSVERLTQLKARCPA